MPDSMCYVLIHDTGIQVDRVLLEWEERLCMRSVCVPTPQMLLLLLSSQ